MKRLALYSLVPFFLFSFMTDNFRLQQQKFPRVKASYEEKEKLMTELLASKGIRRSSFRLFIRAFKEEGELELWAKNASEEKYTLLKTYRICAASGGLGPKRKQGDGQVPEGFYEINRFNPASNYYLSLGVSYPNASDKILGEKGNLGGDIFIHGDCVTIGCMPLTDDKIKEVYLLAVEARSNGQQTIPVHIFPFRMDEKNTDRFEKKYNKNTGLIAFWKNIEKGYASFDQTHTLPSVSVNASGEYSFGN